MSTASVLYKVRRTLGDYGQLFTDRVGGDGVSQVFELSEDTVEPTSVVAALINADGTGTATALVLGTDYGLDARSGLVQLAAPVPVAQILVITGVAYEDFTDEDLLDYIGTALALHTAGRAIQPVLDPVVGAVPPTPVLAPIEERPLSLLAAREVIRDLATQVSKDITIDTGDGTVIPRSQRYQQLTAEAARLDGEYSELVDKLGLPGFDQVTVTSLRRISSTTNRLVPVYVAREWDDPHWFPQRVLPAIPTGALPTDKVITYRGQFVLDQKYLVNDLVDSRGIRYLCLADSTGIDPALDVAAGNGGQLVTAGTDGFGGLAGPVTNFSGQHWQISYINAGMWGFGGGFY